MQRAAFYGEQPIESKSSLFIPQKSAVVYWTFVQYQLKPELFTGQDWCSDKEVAHEV
jgi:hypothetical protein